MLENIYIKNVALIQEQQLDLTKGLNIISGESGSGKSMLIDSINFVLGNKTKKDFIRHLEDEAVVIATFFIQDESIIEQIKSFDIEILEDNLIQIKRTINSNNKTSIKINERTKTLSILRQVGSLLIDVHLQKDNYNILKNSSHIDYLDFVCGDELSSFKSQLSKLVHEYKTLTKNIDDLVSKEQEKQRRLDILNFELDELSDASLRLNEDDELEQRQKMLSNSEKISDNSNEIVSLLYNSNDEMPSTYDKITNAISLLEDIEDVSDTFKKAKDTLIDCQINVEEIAITLKDYSNDIGGDKEELQDIDERIALIIRLKKKYGSTISEILAYQNTISEEIYNLSNSEKLIAKMQKQQSTLSNECLKICSSITKIRKNYIKPICQNIENTLSQLGMEDAKFDIVITENDTFSENGIDGVSFYISTNKGQDLKPLEKIISGGEMSRIMIAIKNLISTNYNIETFIFDEIDTGVSGRTAQKVGEKLLDISKNHQILCITHLPQIAALGDSNILIYKQTIDDKTYTNIKNLDYDGKVQEITRLISGRDTNDSTIQYAKQMISMVRGNSTKTP